MTWTEYFKHVTYKRGHTITVLEEDNPRHPARIIIARMVEDTYNPGKHLRVAFNHTLPAYGLTPSEEYRDRIVRDIFHEMERHEADEWFKKDGVMLFDPHKEKKT